MSSTEASFSVTVKTPRGNLVTVRGDSADGWVANLNAAGASGALGIIAQIEASLSGQAAPAKGIDYERLDKAQQQRQEAAAQPAQELPAGFAEVKCGTCGATAQFAKEGISSKSGKPYKRYACTANQLHAATFTN